MKRYSAFTLACSGSRLNSDFRLTRHWFPLFAGLAMIASLGCQSSNVSRSLLTDSLTDSASLPSVPRRNAEIKTLEAASQPEYRVVDEAKSPAPQHAKRLVALPTTAQYDVKALRPPLVSKPVFQSGQGSGTSAGRSLPQQPNTYQYPATNPPGQQSQFTLPQTGQLAYPPLPRFQQAQFQQSQIQIPQPAYQLQQPGLQTGIPLPNFAQPSVPQPGFGQPVQPGFFPNPNLAGQNLPSIPQPELLDLDVFIPQNPSGRLSVGGTVSSDNSLLGQVILEEHDFDFRAWPRTPSEIFSPSAWRGGGQRFRLEAVPGADLERYLVSWSNPYLRGTETSLSLSAYLFERQYFDYEERRLGGRISVGRRLSQYLTFTAGLRLEDVEIDNPRVNTSSQLNAALGESDLFLGSVGFTYDNRVLPYLTGVGTYFSATFTQAFGDFDYSRGELEFRNHQKIFARPDDSGRHIIGFRSILGFSGNSTPVFENFFAGGISTLRGFDFRGVSPIEGDVRVGGEFQWLNSLEYTFPVTADDLVRGALFVDFGTVEEDVELNSENFRVAPGLGLRVHLPFAGLGAPLSFDFAFPISTAEGDDEQSFSFFIGAIR